MAKHSKGRKSPKKENNASANSSSPPSPSKPRLDQHKRQLSRFYEPLILLFTLGSTRGEHRSDTAPERLYASELSIKDLRRRFLSELAYICDYDKGGETVAAIGLQSTPQCYVFWVAANSCPAKKVIPFLESILAKLKHISTALAVTDADTYSIAEECITFATLRIKKYKSLLRPLLKRCLSELVRRESDDVKDLIVWLQKYEDSKLGSIALCRFAYENRKSKFMQQLAGLSMEPSYKTSKDAIHHAFGNLRHYIGRLGHHFRAAKALVSSVRRLAYLLDNYEVRNVPTPIRYASPPEVDGMTRLDSIIVRMLPKNSPDLDSYRQAITDMDRTANLTSRMLVQYRNPNFRPRVHAEVQALEYFHEQKFTFADSDRYIACSKPACYCCSLYFRHHPGAFVEPPSHYKIHLNWCPPELGSECHIINQHHQRDILNLMTRDIRKDALQQILEKGAPFPWHPDSVTGITESVLVKERVEYAERELNATEAVESSDSFDLFPEQQSTNKHDRVDSESSLYRPQDPPAEILGIESVSDFSRPISQTSSASDPVSLYSDFEDSDSGGGVPL